eukprot:748026-Hanusia_phi.AAC.1
MSARVPKTRCHGSGHLCEGGETSGAFDAVGVRRSNGDHRLTAFVGAVLVSLALTAVAMIISTSNVSTSMPSFLSVSVSLSVAVTLITLCLSVPLSLSPLFVHLTGLSRKQSDAKLLAANAQWHSLSTPQQISLAETMIKAANRKKTALLARKQMLASAPPAANAAGAPAGSTPAAQSPPAPASPVGAQPASEPGFVVATTDDTSSPPVSGGATYHHIKNFAGNEQVMGNGDVAAQGAGADFQTGEVVGESQRGKGGAGAERQQARASTWRRASAQATA